MLERLQSLPPDERERMLERMRARGFDPTAASETPGAGRGGAAAPARSGGPGAAPRTAQATKAPASPQATNIDALFGPLPTVETTGRVWLYIDKQLRPVRVRLGITDGQVTELLRADAVAPVGDPAAAAGPGGGSPGAPAIAEGTELVTNVTTGTEAARPAPSTAFPGFGQQPGRFGGPGGFGGGGFGGGGGGNRGGGGR